MTKRADLFPALGLPSEQGPCLVVQRIEDKVRSPRLRDDLKNKVEQGVALTNPEAAQVYSPLRERGTGMFPQIEITRHAQFRMDLRGVTVPEIRLVLQRFQKSYNDWKSRQSGEARHVQEAVRRGHTIEYEDSKLKLFIAFTIPKKGVAHIVTLYWKGVPDPKAPGECILPLRKQSGYRAPVNEWTTQTYRKDFTNSPDNQEKQQVLPSPPNSRSKPTGPWNFNGPGPSGTGQDGKSVHKDKARTQAQPGGDHPAPPARTSPVRRPEVTGDLIEEDSEELGEMAGWFDRLTLMHEGSVRGKPYPGADRQRNQRGRAKTYSKIRYRQQRTQYKRRMKLWHRKNKRNPRYKKDQERRRKFPERYERRPGGGYRRNQDRSKDWRKDQKTKPKKDPKKAGSPISGWLDEYPVVFSEMFWAGDAPMVEITSPLKDSSVILTLEEFFEDFVVDEINMDSLIQYLDEFFEYEEEEDMPLDVDDALEQMQRMAFQLKYRPKQRQKKQKGRQKWLSRMNHMKSRAKSKRRSRVRYKRLKRLPAFKKQQKIRRQHPERFKRHMASVLTAPEIAFVVGDRLDLGYVRSISPMTGLVSFYRATQRDEGMLWDTVESLPVADFMASVGFLSEYDENAMFQLIDVELGLEAWEDDISEDGLRGSAALMGIDCDSTEFMSMCEKLTGKTQIRDMDPAEVALIDHRVIHQITYDGAPDQAGEFPNRELAKEPDPLDSQLIDPSDGYWFFGQVNLPESASRIAHLWLVRQGELLHDTQGPRMDPDQYFGRADRRKREPEKKPLPLNFPPQVQENPGSAKVIPWNNDSLVNNRAARYRVAATLQDIMSRCGEDVIDRSRGLKAKLVQTDPGTALWQFEVPGSKGAYRVRVQASSSKLSMGEADVKVSCSCPFWQWQGPEHHAKEGGYLYGRPVGTASKPSAKDPSGKHAACKHVIAVLSHISRNVRP